MYGQSVDKFKMIGKIWTKKKTSKNKQYISK